MQYSSESVAVFTKERFSYETWADYTCMDSTRPIFPSNVIIPTVSPSQERVCPKIRRLASMTSHPPPLVHKPPNTNPVVQRHQVRLQPAARNHGAVELPQAVYLDFADVLGLRLCLLRPRVVRAVIGHDAPAQDVVRDDEAARPEEPVRCAGLRLGQDLGQVLWVATLLSVDEDEVVGLGRVELGKSGDWLLVCDRQDPTV